MADCGPNRQPVSASAEERVGGISVLTYLEHYPLPAVIWEKIPSEPPRNADETSYQPVWSNRPWKSLVNSEESEEPYHPAPRRSFFKWLSDDLKEQQIDATGQDVFELELRTGARVSFVKTYLPAAIPGAKPLVVTNAINSVAGAPSEEKITGNAGLPVSGSAIKKGSSDISIPSRSAGTYSDIDELPPLSSSEGDGPTSTSESNTTPETDCRILFEQIDWSKTCLGPREKWSPSLEVMVGIVMASETQDGLWLGKDFTMIYNQHYAKTVDHPRVFGKSAKDAWGDVWPGVHHLVRKCIEDGKASYTPDDLLLYEGGPRGHYIEKYHTWSIIPVFNLDGSVLGTYNPTTDQTAGVLAFRRQQTTKNISDRVSIARTTEEFYGGLAEAVEDNAKDVPFLLCYSVQKKMDNSLKEDSIFKLGLESSVGVPKGHPAAPDTLEVDLRSIRKRSAGLDLLSSPTLSAISRLTNEAVVPLISNERQSWPIVQALMTRQCVVVDDCTDLVAGFPLRQWDHLPYSAIVIPICSDMSSDIPRGVLVMGLNLYSTLDERYLDWIQVTRSQLTSALSSVYAYMAEQERLKDQERLERAKTAWFQGAAHELRSPLTLVAGPLGDVLESEGLLPQHRKALSLAHRNVQRIQRLVNALLDFSRIEAGKMTARRVAMDLGQFVRDIAALFLPAVQRRGFDYHVQIDDSENPTLIDPVLMETVVTNLLSNALKYTERGGITVRLHYTATHAEIAVIDTGFGIPQAELASVTDRFHRATSALSRGTEGTGIGLALSKEIIRLHEGEFLMQSRTAEESSDGTHGSTFTARLPLSSRETGDEISHSGYQLGSYGKEVVAEAMHWARGNSVDTASETDRQSETDTDHSSLMIKGQVFMFQKDDVILLADDNIDVRRYVKQFFSPFCQVVEASNGEEAFKMARRAPPDLILSDLMMPRMNGQELLQAIRQDPITRYVPMVLLSAATDEQSRLSALTTGVDDFISKPFKPKELLARVHLQMQLGKRRAKLEALFAQREREISLLSDYCPSGIIRQTADGAMIYGNAAWRGYVGMSDGDHLDIWPSRVDPSYAGSPIPDLRDFYYGDASELHQTWRWLNGRIVTGTFIRLDKVIPGMTGILGCFNDVTDQEERVMEAERRRIEAEESKRQQELLIDFTSHEIRTPVSAILQCSSLVKENLTGIKTLLDGAMRSENLHGYTPTADLLETIEQDIEALDSIYQCGLVQERIANDILSLARIQLDTLSLYIDDVDIRKEGQKLISVFASEAKMKEIELVLEYGQSDCAMAFSTIRTDHVRFGQVVTNLISNAIKFTATSKVRRITVAIDLSLVPPPEEECVPPADTSGILPSSAITEEGSGMIHSQYGGSGLGLFICKKITEMLGGRIEVQSELGKGSAFRFFVECRTSSPKGKGQLMIPTEDSQSATSGPGPLISADTSGGSVLQMGARPLDRVSPPSSNVKSTVKAKPKSQSPKTPASEGLHVLIVEDNIINQTVLKRQLTKSGFTCEVADNGQIALDMLDRTRSATQEEAQSRPYDVIFLDLEMPVMDGLTAIKKIREGETLRPLSRRQYVVALTGNARQAQIDGALASGMDDVIIKPYRLPDLISRVRKAIKNM